VQSSWPKHLLGPTAPSGTIEKSGTSFATPIAASIASFLLQYASLYLDKEQFGLMKRYQGMRSVLKLIATKEGYKRRGDYDYIALIGKGDSLFGRSEGRVKKEIIKVLEGHYASDDEA